MGAQVLGHTESADLILTEDLQEKYGYVSHTPYKFALNPAAPKLSFGAQEVSVSICSQVTKGANGPARNHRAHAQSLASCLVRVVGFSPPCHRSKRGKFESSSILCLAFSASPFSAAVRRPTRTIYCPKNQMPSTLEKFENQKLPPKFENNVNIPWPSSCRG